MTYVLRKIGSIRKSKIFRGAISDLLGDIPVNTLAEGSFTAVCTEYYGYTQYGTGGLAPQYRSTNSLMDPENPLCACQMKMQLPNLSRIYS